MSRNDTRGGLGGVIPIVIDVEKEPQVIHFTVDNRTNMEISFYIYGDSKDMTQLSAGYAETINGSMYNMQVR